MKVTAQEEVESQKICVEGSSPEKMTAARKESSNSDKKLMETEREYPLEEAEQDAKNYSFSPGAPSKKLGTHESENDLF